MMKMLESLCLILTKALFNAKICNKIHKNFPFKRTHVYMDVINVIYSEEYETMNSVEISDFVRNEINTQLKRRKESI